MKIFRKNTKKMSLGDAAEFLGITPAVICRMIEDGELVAEKSGDSYQIEKQVVEAYKAFEEKSTFEANTDCGCCGWRYSSKESFKGRCTKCGAPICFDCWIRKKNRVCSDCEKS